MDDTVEAMLAEGLMTLHEMCPDIRVGDVSSESTEAERAAAEQGHMETAGWTREAEELREAAIPTEEVEPDVPNEIPLAIDELPSDPKALDERNPALALNLAHRDLLMGEVARRLLVANRWRRLGYVRSDSASGSARVSPFRC